MTISKIETIYNTFKRNAKKGLTVAEVLEKNGWTGEAERASVSSLVSRLRSEGSLTMAGTDFRGAGGRSAPVYKLA